MKDEGRLLLGALEVNSIGNGPTLSYFCPICGCQLPAELKRLHQIDTRNLLMVGCAWFKVPSCLPKTATCSRTSGAYMLGHRQLQQVNRLLSIFVMDPEES
jgi:hypothetical protein